MGLIKKYRVFKETVFWATGFFIFEESVNFEDIKNNSSTSFLKKDNFLGTFSLDEDFVKLFKNKKLNNGFLYFEYLWEDDTPPKQFKDKEPFTNINEIY